MAPTTSTLLIKEFMDNFHYSRRLLPEAATMAPPPAAAGISHDPVDDLPIGNHVNSFDANVIMVFAVLVSALICSLVLNSIIKCVFRCSTLILVDSYSNHTNPSSTNKGIKKKALQTFPVITYTTELKQSEINSECVICLSEFIVGERVKVLPKCNHGFHVKCIDKWLNSHSSCPNCRHCLIETCQKIINGDSSATTNAISSPTIGEVVIRIEPLEREGIIPN